jgi:hypothetical protein
MIERITRKPVTFARPFVLEGIEGEQSAGTYDVEMVEELLEGLSFPAYRLMSASVVLPLRQGFHSYQLVRILPALVREALTDPEPARNHVSRADAEKST